MKLSTALAYTGDPTQAAAQAHDLETAGIDMIWVACGTNAVDRITSTREEPT